MVLQASRRLTVLSVMAYVSSGVGKTIVQAAGRPNEDDVRCNYQSPQQPASITNIHEHARSFPICGASKAEDSSIGSNIAPYRGPSADSQQTMCLKSGMPGNEYSAMPPEGDDGANDCCSSQSLCLLGLRRFYARTGSAGTRCKTCSWKCILCPYRPRARVLQRTS